MAKQTTVSRFTTLDKWTQEELLDWATWDDKVWSDWIIESIENGEQDERIAEIGDAVRARLSRLGYKQHPLGESLIPPKVGITVGKRYVVDFGERRTKWNGIEVEVTQVHSVNVAARVVKEGPYSYQGRSLMGVRVRVPRTCLREKGTK